MEADAAERRRRARPLLLHAAGADLSPVAHVLAADAIETREVDSLDDAMRHVNVATQTVGFSPPERMADYRDRLASGGAQRIVRLGEAGPSTIGNPALPEMECR